MKGPYLENIGKNNHSLESAKKNLSAHFLLYLILNFDFSKSHHVKSKNENHQNSMCDSSKEPH